MNSPAETTPQDETRSAFCARCGYAWYIHGSFDFDDLCDAFVAKEPRVAVVRPTRDQLARTIFETNERCTVRNMDFRRTMAWDDVPDLYKDVLYEITDAVLALFGGRGF